MIKYKVISSKTYKVRPKISLRLFYSYIKPVLTYASNIWSTAGSTYSTQSVRAKDPHTQHLIDLAHIEQVHYQFCKYILGVGITTNTAGSLAELGRYPLEIDIKINIVKYWLMRRKLPSSHILRQSYT
jgi:hypothetical protein